MQLNFVPTIPSVQKTLVVDFCQTGKISCETGNGLLDVELYVWEQMLAECKCHILSTQKSKDVFSFVLPESSLFLMRHKMILKTCGKMDTLNAIPHLIRVANEMNSALEFVHFYHTDFISPMIQHAPQSSFQQEMLFLNRNFPSGRWLSFAPPHGQFGSKWHVFVADFTKKSAPQSREATLEIHMSGLDPSVVRLFTNNADKQKIDLSASAGINFLLPGFKLDEHFFEPCGYSMNALDSAKSYATIHVMPDPECSYISFETNAADLDLTALVAAMLSKFKPQNATVVLFSDDELLRGGSVENDYRRITTGPFEKFDVSQVSTHQFSEGYTLSLTHLRRIYSVPVVQKSKTCTVDASLLVNKWRRIQPFLPDAQPVFPMNCAGADNFFNLMETNCVFSVSSGAEVKSALDVSPLAPLIMINSCKTKGQLQLAATNGISVTFQGVDDLARIAQHCPACPLIYDVGVLNNQINTDVHFQAVGQGLTVAGIRFSIDQSVNIETVASLETARQSLHERGQALGCVHVCLKKTTQMTPHLLLRLRQASAGIPLFVDFVSIEATDATF